MNDETKNRFPWELPVVIRYGDEVLDRGFAPIPRLFLQVYADLGLSDAVAMFLVHLLDHKRDAGNPAARIGDLPMTASIKSRQRYVRILRQRGILFTRRIYYARDPDQPPRIKAIEFDLRNLLYNLVRWTEWKNAGRLGTFEIRLHPEVAQAIVANYYHYVPRQWHEEAQRIAESLPPQSGPVQSPGPPPQNGVVGTPTGPEWGSRDAAYRPKMSAHYKESTLRETLSANAESGPPGGPLPSPEQMFQTPSPAAAGTGSPGRLPTGETVEGQASPAGVSSQGVGEAPVRPAGSRVEPLPERRRRVLADLRRIGKNRRKRVAIVTQNVGEILGLGLDDGGALRTQPVKDDYARVGRMMREHGDEAVWLAACQAAGAAIEGDPLDYLEACLRRAGQGRKRSRRDNYPETPDEYSDAWII